MLKLKNRKIYYVLFFVFLTCYAMKVIDLPLPAFLYYHISNFAITGGLFMLFNKDILLDKGFDKSTLLVALLPFALLNIFIEFFVRIDSIRFGFMEFTNFNTPDPRDAVFGLLSLVFIYFVVMNYSVPVKTKR